MTMVQWYTPSPREVLVGHHFLSYPEEEKNRGLRLELVQQHMQRQWWPNTVFTSFTFGPAFPVGPLGPLSPRGPLRKSHSKLKITEEVSQI